MKKIDIYILKKLLSTFLYVVAILVLIICVIDYTDKNDKFITYEISSDVILQYYLSFAPYFAALLTPITSFIATVLVTAKMASQTELIAIMSSGVSFRRIIRPFMIGAAMIGVGSFYLNNFVIPDANKFRVQFETEYIKKPTENLDTDIHFKIGPQEYVYLSRFSTHSETGYTVTLERFIDHQLIEKITADRIVWDTASNKWTLNNWIKRTLQEDHEIIEQGRRLDTLLAMTPQDFEAKRFHETTLTLPELNAYIALQLSRGADDVDVYRVEKYIRFMQPFTVFILMFIGIVLSARKSRRGTGFQIAMAFLIAFIFIILFVFAQAIAAAGTMSPLLAIWLPNIFFGTLGLVLYNTVPR